MERVPLPREEDALTRRANPAFLAMLLHAPFQAIDADNRGTIDFEEFAAYFGGWATPEEKYDVFTMIDDEGAGFITYALEGKVEECKTPGEVAGP